MQVKLDDERYEDLWLEWQHDVAVCLKEALKESKIKGDQAHEIVGNFLFSLSMVHDQVGVELKNNTFTPRLGFVDEAGVLITSSEDSHMHEAAFGNADEAFGR